MTQVVILSKNVPELKSFSEYVHEPSKVPPLLMDLEMPDKNYPNPIVDVSLAANKARKKKYGHIVNSNQLKVKI